MPIKFERPLCRSPSLVRDPLRAVRIGTHSILSSRLRSLAGFDVGEFFEWHRTLLFGWIPAESVLND